jgi:hypothetical protein
MCLDHATTSRTLERVEKGAPEMCSVTGTKTLTKNKKNPWQEATRRCEGRRRAYGSWENILHILSIY